jgi:hypothetical protein
MFPMADYRDDNRGRANAPRRDSSIFTTSDRTDRWREDHQRWSSSGSAQGSRPGGASDYRHNQGSQSSDDRGFFDRAGDEVRSWFGDEEAERRREADARRYEQEHGISGRYRGGGHEDQWTGGAPDGQYSRDRMSSSYGQSAGYGQERAQSGYGQSAQSFGGRQQGDHYGRPGGQGAETGGYSRADYARAGGSSGQTGAAHDEAYRRWREQQIQALDREYQEYCQHRQHQFEQDFSTFRQSRRSGVTSGGPTMSHGGAPRGSTEITGSSGSHATDPQSSGESAGRNAAATTTGSGTASAATSSVGSTGMAAETGNRLPGAGSGSGTGRSGKSRS